MSAHDDLPPTDAARLRSALQQRATGETSVAPAELLSSARRRGATLYRRQMAAGAFVALLFAGGLVGAVAANHGRTTVGVSVAGPPATTEAPTTSWTGPTTTAGVRDMHPLVPCGDSFFTAGTWTALEAHFGPKMDCGRVGNTWLVSFRGTTIAAGLLRCDPGDAACLDGATVHDPASFKVVLLPPVTPATTGATWSTGSVAGVMDPRVDLTWLPLVPPTPQPVSSIRITGTPSDLSLEFGQTCEYTQGPSTTHWTGKPMDTTSFADALSVPVPDWRTENLGPSISC
jgi:hypothetical protein